MHTYGVTEDAYDDSVILLLAQSGFERPPSGQMGRELKCSNVSTITT